MAKRGRKPKYAQLGIEERVYKEAVAVVCGEGKTKPDTKEQAQEVQKVALSLQKKFNRIKERKREHKFLLLNREEAMYEIQRSEYFQDYIKRRKITASFVVKQMILFAAAYVEFGVVSKAEMWVGLSHDDRLNWQKECKSFAEAVNKAKEEFLDDLEAIGLKRAKDKSDSLLKFFLQAYRPAKFRTQLNVDAQLSAQNGVKLVFADGMLSPEEQELVKIRQEEQQQEELVN